MTCVLAVVRAVGCWENPFPLVHLADGGYMTNPLDEYLLVASAFVSLLTVVLAAFGRGGSRILMILIGLLLLVLTTFGFISNYV